METMGKSREDMLALLGLDYTITKAEAEYVYVEKKNADFEQVLDLVSGYGSNLFGHYYPPFVETIQEAINKKIPVFTQLSNRKLSNDLCDELSRIAFDETGIKYKALLLNTGTESVEAAMKHALLAYEKKKDEWIEKKIRNFQRKEMISKTVSCEGSRQRSHEVIQKWLREINNIFRKNTPVFLSLKKAYHGKTLGALSLTHQKKWRAQFGNSAYKTCFVNYENFDLEATIIRYSIKLPLPGKSETETWLPFAGFFAEPLQGEGGVFPLKKEKAAYIEKLKNTLDIPLIWDEIQSGSYRCGKLLYSSLLDAYGDYCLLGKALGGGLMKVSALLVRDEIYEKEFSLLHTSTFAEDELSSAVALRFLKEAELQKNEIKSKEKLWKAELENVQDEYPVIIKEIRGAGLIYGIEFRKFYKSGSYGLQALSRSGYFNYFMAAWLFHNHQIRVSSPLSNDHTLRIHPPVCCDHENILKSCEAIRHLCEVLHKVDFYGLIDFLLPEKWQHLRPWPQSIFTEDVIWEKSFPDAPKAGFITHYIDCKTITEADESLKCLPIEAHEFLLNKFLEILPPIVTGQRNVTLQNCENIHLTMVGLPFTSSMAKTALQKHLVARFRHKVSQGVDFLEKRRTNVIGLGQYNSILTLNGRSLQSTEAAITTGNGYTAFLTINALLHQSEIIGIDSCHENLAVIGASGNIGSVAAFALAKYVNEIYLVGSDSVESELKLAKLKEEIIREHGKEISKIHIRNNLDEVVKCKLVLVATNQPESFIYDEHLHPEAIVCDVSVPANIDRTVIENPGKKTIFYGGIAKLPDNKPLPTKGFPLELGLIYGCLAETLILAASNNMTLASTGILEIDKIEGLGILGERLGLDLVGIKSELIL